MRQDFTTSVGVPRRSVWISPAKINLYLRVGRAGEDGYHPLQTWIVRVGLFDKLSFEFDPSTTMSPLTPIELTCDAPGIPCDEGNLVVRAIRAVAGRRVVPPVRVRLEKSIPSGGGLGGGSSDAACVLRALDSTLGLNLGEDELHELAARLGSDVPSFLGPPSLVASGRGECLRPATPPAIGGVLLALPTFGLSTAAVYRQFDAMRPDAPLPEPIDPDVWAALPARALLERLVNDLELPAFALEPKLARTRLELERRLGRVVRMSGSGSTLFTLYDDLAEAKYVAESQGALQSDLGLRLLPASIGDADVRPA